MNQQIMIQMHSQSNNRNILRKSISNNMFNIHPQQQYNRYGNTNQYNIHEHNQRPRERARHRDHSVNPSNTNQFVVVIMCDECFQKT